MQRDLGVDRSAVMSSSRPSARTGSWYGRLVAPLVSGLDAEIEQRGESLARDMELRHLAHRVGDRESVRAFEFRMRETYGELLPRLLVRGLVNVVPHLGVLLALYYLLPVLTLPGGAVLSTVSAYIAVGITVLLVRALSRTCRRHRQGARTHQQPDNT